MNTEQSSVQSSVLRPPSSVLRLPSSALRPLVSICLPTLNARRFLEPRMQTILSQTLTDWELIVCDSFSSDGTWEYFQQFKHDQRVRLYQVPKEGLYAGWNECLRRCRGEYVYIATADDTCKPELLEKMVAALEAGQTADRRPQTADRRRKTEDNLEKTTDCRPQTADFLGGEASGSDDAEQGLQSAVCGLQSSTQGLQSAVCSLQSGLPADIAVCNFDYIDENGEIIDPLLPPAGAFYGDDRYRAHRRSGYMEFLVHLLIGTSWTTMTAVLFRRSLLEKTGLFVTDAGPLADRFWAYKSALHSDTIVMSETLATWRQHAQQGTSPSRNRSMRNVRRLWRKTIEVVEACVPLMPDAWTRDPAFLEKLLWAERRHYYDLYHLSRTELRYRMSVFCKGVLQSLVLEPRFLTMRIATCFSWDKNVTMTEREYVNHLMKEWYVPSDCESRDE